MPGTSQVAFASACAARMAKPYRQAVAIAGLGDANLIDSALDQLARFVGGADGYVDWPGLAERLAANIPDADEMGSLLCQVLDDALASTAYAARSAIAFDSHLADMDVDQPIAVMKLDREDQLALVEANPGVLLPHRYHARHGWAVVLLEHADAPLLGMLLRLAWACVAPKRLLNTANSARPPSILRAPKLVG